ncbi:MAG: twin-arginine translocase subunit TatB [Gammaproteobacteria bacterium]|nr:twin-arginine translocase subunit TatB [Gammaproteobacteria bacterium]
MFDVGFSEILLLAVLGLLILGPERLPAVAKTLGGWVRRGRLMAREFQQELEREVDMQGLRELQHDFEDASRPLKEAANTLDEGRSILDKSLSSEWDPMEKPKPQSSTDVTASSGSETHAKGPSKTADG